MKLFSFKNFLKKYSFFNFNFNNYSNCQWCILPCIDKIQEKNNLMDIEEYSPISSLKVLKKITGSDLNSLLLMFIAINGICLTLRPVWSC